MITLRLHLNRTASSSSNIKDLSQKKAAHLLAQLFAHVPQGSGLGLRPLLELGDLHQVCLEAGHILLRGRHALPHVEVGARSVELGLQQGDDVQ